LFIVISGQQRFSIAAVVSRQNQRVPRRNKIGFGEFFKDKGKQLKHPGNFRDA